MPLIISILWTGLRWPADNADHSVYVYST